MSYTEALKAAKRVGASKANDAGVMALFCASSLQMLVGAASPKLVFEGAQRAGLTALQLSKMANTNPNAVHDLMWS